MIIVCKLLWQEPHNKTVDHALRLTACMLTYGVMGYSNIRGSKKTEYLMSHCDDGLLLYFEVLYSIRLLLNLPHRTAVNTLYELADSVKVRSSFTVLLV